MTVSLPTSVASGVTAATPEHSRHGGLEKTVKAVADQLGMSTDDLRKALAGGQSMSDLAAAKGVSKEALVQTIASTLPSTGRDGAALDATAMATRIADSTRQAPPPRPSASSSGTASSDLGQGIEALAGALGVSTDDLLERLTGGSGISDLLSANPDVSSQLAALQNKGGMVDGYA
jgi:uncharacterized protein YidB (DUF937 family)